MDTKGPVLYLPAHPSLVMYALYIEKTCRTIPTYILVHMYGVHIYTLPFASLGTFTPSMYVCRVCTGIPS